MSRKFQTKIFGAGTAGKIVRWLSPNTLQADIGIVNADVAVGAAIAKSKLASLNIVDEDIAAGAGITQSKLAGFTISRPVRALNTIYTNSTGKTIIVSVSVTISTVAAVYAYADTGADPITLRQRDDVGAAGGAANLSFIVLNNEKYKITVSSGTPTLIGWDEVVV